MTTCWHYKYTKYTYQSTYFKVLSASVNSHFVREVFMKVTIKKLLGSRIKELRHGRGLSQEQLAEIVDIDTKHLSRIETGLSAPTVDRLDIIADALNVEVRSLFEFGHLDNREVQLAGIDKMLKQLDENDLKVIYRIVRSFIG